jgi:hypothetical protein
VHKAYHSLNKLASIGIDLAAVTRQLENEGVEKFIVAYDQLMASLQEKASTVHELHGSYLRNSNEGSESMNSLKTSAYQTVAQHSE